MLKTGFRLTQVPNFLAGPLHCCLYFKVGVAFVTLRIDTLITLRREEINSETCVTGVFILVLSKRK